MSDTKSAVQKKSLVEEANAKKQKSGGWLITGIVVSAVASLGLWFGVFYVQAEMLSPAGEPVVSALDGSEAVQIARSSTFAVGSVGAVVAILLAYRRQRSTEAAHWHQVETTTENFILERAKQDADRISALHDRYTKAVEQLADGKAAIRLGGVHAIAALAEDWYLRGNHEQRQVCVDLLCSYLRSVRRNEVKSAKTSAVVNWDIDTDFLKEDRDVRKSALEWLSRVASAEAARSTTQDGDEPKPEVKIDLRGISLRGMDLNFARLAHLQMSDADLVDTRLYNANLAWVNMFSADLSHANLLQADLSNARLESAKLGGTRLAGANLKRAQLHAAYMEEASLLGAKLHGAQFVEADLSNASLRGAKVDEDTLFTGAKLDGTDFTSVDVAVLDLTATDTSNAKGIRPPRRVRAAEDEQDHIPDTE